MKKLSTILIVCLLAIAAKAQITITSNDMPGMSDTLRFSTANVDAVTDSTYQITGANVTWDFSHLVANSQGLESYLPSLQTPYAGFFFGFNRYGKLEADSIGFGQFVFRDVYRFYKNTNTQFEIEGVGLKYSGFPIPSYYDDNDEVYQFPLEYNDFDSSTFDYTLSLLTLGSLNTKGYRTNSVDGWGQITTPYGTFMALRVTTDIVSTDSVALGFLNFAFPNHQREVKWLANGEGYPIVQVSGAVLAGNFTPTTVEYRDTFKTFPPSPFAPTAAFEADNLTPFTNDTVTFTSNAFLATHAWTFTPNTVTYVNGTNSASRTPEVLFDVSGLYDVSLNVSNVFGSDDTTIVEYIDVSFVSNTTNLALTNGLKVFPNPTSNLINLAYHLTQNEKVMISVFDLQGRELAILLNQKQTVGEQNATFNLADYNLSNGVYLIKARTDKGIMIRKFVKN